MFGTSELFQVYRSTEDDFDQFVQTQIDSALRSFLSRFQQLEESDRLYERPNILSMPLTTLSTREWSLIQTTMIFKLGNSSFNDKFAGKQITLRQEYAFRTAMIELTGSSTYLDKWEKNEITAADQQAIDSNARFFIEIHQVLRQTDQIVPRMPNTGLAI